MEFLPGSWTLSILNLSFSSLVSIIFISFSFIFVQAPGSGFRDLIKAWSFLGFFVSSVFMNADCLVRVLRLGV